MAKLTPIALAVLSIGIAQVAHAADGEIEADNINTTATFDNSTVFISHGAMNGNTSVNLGGVTADGGSVKSKGNINTNMHMKDTTFTVTTLGGNPNVDVNAGGVTARGH